jgi:hypothetical protein
MVTLRLAKFLIFFSMVALPLCADFTYQSTSRITGGVLTSAMKFAGAFSKDARKAMDPIAATTAIKGNRMVHRSADLATIVDIDKETITNVDFAKRTYSVMTFAQMKQMMDDASQKMQQKAGNDPAADLKFDIKLKDTGASKSINGNNAHEVVMTMTMQGTDAKSGAKGGIDMTTDMWIAPNVAGYQEVRDFYRRMGEKLAWMPAANPMINRPDMQRAMAEMYKEGSKLDGMPVYQTMRMGGNMEGMPTDDSAQQTSRSRSSAPPTSVGDALGSALGGRLGLGGFGRKKKEAPPATDTAAAAPADSNSAAGSLMEMTTEVNSMSTATADAAMFEVPAGFAQVQEDPAHPGRRR